MERFWNGPMRLRPLDVMAGHKQTLVASHPGNVNAVRHGVHSRTGRVLAQRAAELADELMQLSHVQPLDRLAAEEIGGIVVRLEAIDKDLDERCHFGRGGARSLLDHKAQRRCDGRCSTRISTSAKAARPVAISKDEGTLGIAGS
jgi:hypothetical protein